MPTVVLSAFSVANFPEGGGHFWVYLQYVLGLRQLGCEVYWLEGFRANGNAEQQAAALVTFRARMEQFGLGGKVILYFTPAMDTDSLYGRGARVWKRPEATRDLPPLRRPGVGRRRLRDSLRVACPRRR